MTTLVVMSDTHGHHRKVPLPPGDVLVHCGDTLLRGKEAELADFLDWIAQVPYRHKVFIGGNHDWALEGCKLPIPKGVTYLLGQAAQVAGVRFFGAPWRPRPAWVKADSPPGRYSAFGVMLADIEARWAEVPADTQVLVTHVPPHEVLDLGPVDPDGQQRRRGCPALRQRVEQVRPQFHLFGHNHEEPGLLKRDGTTFVNAALLNNDYELIRPPIVLEV